MVSKNILFTHIDLDGAGCAVLFKSFMQFEYVYYINHGPENKVDRDIKKILYRCQDLSKVNVFISDISPSLDETYRYILNNCSSLQILDHHETQVEFAKKYKKNFIYSTDKCGTLLVKQYLSAWGLWESSFIKDWDYFVELVNDIDLWTLKHVFSKDLDRLFSFMGLTRFVENFTSRPYMLYRYNDIIEILKDNEKNYIEKVIAEKMPAFMGEYVFAENYKNEICNQIANENNDRIAIGISMKNKMVSLRSIGDIDVSRIAVNNGGGGHKNAAGFSFKTLEEIDNFIKTGKKINRN
jgi:oligoribonuclease NrnB/cAMP/cGMP phosphodiesterase (DHH superfamily)